MRSMIRMAFNTLRSFWKVVLLMIIFFAITVFAYLLLNGYKASARRLFQTLNQDYLIVHETDTEAEFYGSRIPTQIGRDLQVMGCSQVVPVFHSTTGTLGRNFQFVMGVDLAQYQDVEQFEMLAGRALQVGDHERLAMVGRTLAEREDIAVGDVYQLRGRDFEVIGIFETRAFYDNDAWISLSSAQKLFGWGDDVSYYIIPDEGIVQPGDVLAEKTIASRRGQTVMYATGEMFKTIDLFQLIVNLTGISTALALGNVIFRLASIQKYHLAVLRAVGFSRFHISFNILIQAGLIFVFGFALGVIAAVVFPYLYELVLYDILIMPDITANIVIKTFVTLGGIALLSIAIPLVWIYLTNPATLLRSE